jgi:hypothetical protein
MNPDYLWFADATQLLTLFVISPLLAIVIALKAFRATPHELKPKKYGIVCVASGLISVVLVGLAKWMNADIRTPQYLLQLAGIVLGGLLLGVSMGCGFRVLLSFWRWHKATRLTQ